jgi:hypothetical protein
LAERQTLKNKTTDRLLDDGTDGNNGDDGDGGRKTVDTLLLLLSLLSSMGNLRLGGSPLLKGRQGVTTGSDRQVGVNS